MLKIQHFIITRFNFGVSEFFATDKNQASTQGASGLIIVRYV
jgi:hypothetical protein